MSTLRSPFASGFTDEAADDLARTLKVLADPTRLKILGLLRGDPMTVSELTAELPLKQPTISHHLRLLREAGLITTATNGVFRTSSLVTGQVRTVAALLKPGRAS